MAYKKFANNASTNNKPTATVEAELVVDTCPPAVVLVLFEVEVELFTVVPEEAAATVPELLATIPELVPGLVVELEELVGGELVPAVELEELVECELVPAVELEVELVELDVVLEVDEVELELEEELDAVDDVEVGGLFPSGKPVKA